MDPVISLPPHFIDRCLPCKESKPRRSCCRHYPTAIRQERVKSSRAGDTSNLGTISANVVKERAKVCPWISPEPTCLPITSAIFDDVLVHPFNPNGVCFEENEATTA
ncbi:unnamed protein product [Brassica oleracea]